MAKFDELLKGVKGTLTYEEEIGFCLGADALLNKACEWLKEHAFSWIDDNKVNEATRKLKQQKIKELQDDFRKAMEEEI